ARGEARVRARPAPRQSRDGMSRFGSPRVRKASYVDVMTPSAVESPAGLIITGCTVLTHDDQERIGFTEDAAVVVRDGVVEEVTTAGAVAGRAADEWIDGRGQIALPGLINCHTHAPMVVLRGLAEDLPTEEWFNDVVWPVEANLTERDVELGARLACAEMIRAGVTCF